MATMQSTVSTVPWSTPYCHSAKNYCQNLILLDGLGDNDTIIRNKQSTLVELLTAKNAHKTAQILWHASNSSTTLGWSVSIGTSNAM